MRTFKEDYLTGIKNEEEIINILKTKKKFKDIKKTVSYYEKFDFFNDKYEIELKTRNVKYDKYTTSIIACDKVTRISGKLRKLYLFFKYEDGLYYIKYKKKVFKNIEVIEFKRNFRVDFNDKLKRYFNIPIGLLKKFN